MKILLIFSGLGYNRGRLRILITSAQKRSEVEVTHCINRKKKANNGEKKIKILILKPSYFIIKGSRMWPDNAKWKNIYI